MRAGEKAIYLMKHVFFAILVGLLTSSCATKSITFRADSAARVSLVTFDDLNDESAVLGPTPVTIAMKDLTGKVVKIAEPGKQSLYWVVSESAGDQVEARVKLIDAPAPAKLGGGVDARAPDGDTKFRENRVLRLVMKAYKALSGKRFALASEMADQATKIDPEIAAPFVIKGIAQLQLGDRAGATASFAKAKALDPEDSDIDRLASSLGLVGRP
jgi:hypothetical protein